MVEPGTVIVGRYELGARLGASGQVHRAQDRVTHAQVAVKLMSPSFAMGSDAKEHFRRAAFVASSLGDPGIVPVLDAGYDADVNTLFLAMKLLDGEDRRAHVRRPGTTRGRALVLVDALLEPLAAAHERRFLHLDLKPENVFVESSGRVTLLDFAHVKNLRTAQKGGATAVAGAALTDPHYMAPEQLQGIAASPATDVWSTGTMLYELLAGAPPFGGAAAHVRMGAIIGRPHIPLADLSVRVGPRLSELVDRTLAKSPLGRPADAGTLRTELRAALAADPDSASEPVQLEA